ncbi:hypothetical protein CJ030_MR8G002349 [Morella rubra]|uniref:Pentatricopeptide repeat-containing protein n=1 Tax=Morella rubra TaxID=262757 RepID=A0A6A1UQ31_9ROSI|nr:hypothetical protein CJ030_MR8G002349 [Morella rubra]
MASTTTLMVAYSALHQPLPRPPSQAVHARLVLFSVTSSNFLASKLITFYCKSNNLREARCVFDKILEKNIFSWKALLIGFSLHSMHLEVLKLFSFLVFANLRDVKPDCYTISCTLKALSSAFRHSRLANEIHCFVLHRRWVAELFVVNALITYYSIFVFTSMSPSSHTCFITWRAPLMPSTSNSSAC